MVLVMLGAVWLGAVVLGTDRFMQGERDPGPETAAPAAWPNGTSLSLAPKGDTLVMIAHPKCPCTRASLDGLAQIVTRAPGTLTCYVLFWRPSDLPASWVRTSLWEQAKEIPGVIPVDDEGGREASLFGAATSGQVFLFNRSGALRFIGGLTSSRGARGESAGTTTILSYLSTGRIPFSRTPVFGCPLNEPDSKR